MKTKAYVLKCGGQGAGGEKWGAEASRGCGQRSAGVDGGVGTTTVCLAA